MSDTNTARRRPGWSMALGAILLTGVGTLVIWTVRTRRPQEATDDGLIQETFDDRRPFDPAVDTIEGRLEDAPEPLLAEIAQQIAGSQGVVCGIEPRVDGAASRLSLDGADGTWLAIAAAHAHVLVLSEIPETGSGTLLVEGFAPQPVSWSNARDGAGSCDPDPITLSPAEAGVVGTVVGGTGGTFGLTACGQSVTPDRDGDFYAAATPGQPCVVELRRHYGVWEWVDRVQVTPERDRDAVVEVEVPQFDAVLPLVIEAGRVRAVWDDELGDTLVGARVLEVDGEAVPGDPEGFHLATGGDEGHVASVLVEINGRRQTVDVPLRRLSFEDWLVR